MDRNDRRAVVPGRAARNELADQVLSAEELEDQAALELPARRAMSLLGGSALAGGGLLGGVTPSTAPSTLPAGSAPDATGAAASTATLAHQAGTPPPDAAAQPYSPTETSSASS